MSMYNWIARVDITREDKRYWNIGVLFAAPHFSRACSSIHDIVKGLQAAWSLQSYDIKSLDCESLPDAPLIVMNLITTPPRIEYMGGVIPADEKTHMIDKFRAYTRGEA